jgi:O-antigen ligase
MRSNHSLLGADFASRAFLGCLALYVLVLPISGTTALRSLAFAAMVLITGGVLLRRRLPPAMPLWPAWGAYLAIALASLSYAANPGYSLGEIKVEVLYPYLLFAITATWVRQEAELAAVVALLLVGNLVFAIGSAVTLYTHGIDLVSGTGAWNTGVGATATVVVTVLPWLAAALVRAHRSRPRLVWPLALLAVADLAVLLLTMNRQSWLALAAALLTAALLAGRAFWNRRRLAAALVAGLVLAALIGYQFQLRARGVANASGGDPLGVSIAVMSRDSRPALWRFSIERIGEHPLTGGGFGREAFELLYADFHRQSHDLLWHAHNMVLNKGIQMGVPGMVAFLALWASLVAASRPALRSGPLRLWGIAAMAMIAAVFARNMTDDFFVRDHALLFWLLAGALLGCIGEGRRAAGSGDDG